MYRCAGLHVTAAQGFEERRRVRLADAEVFGTQGKAEIVRQPQPAYVGIAVGDHAQGVVMAQDLQHRLHLRENLHLVAGMQEYFETFVGQLLRMFSL